MQAVGWGFDVAVVLGDGRAQLFESLDVQVDGTAADGAAAGQRDAGEAAAGDERAEDERGGAHGLDEFVRSFGVGEIRAVNGGAVLGAAVAEFDFGAHGGEQVARGFDVADLGNVFEDDGSSVSRAAAMQGSAAFFAPLTRMVPSSGSPPRMTSLSIEG